MTIDIRGTSTINKGAQLMLLAIVEQLGQYSSLSATPRGSDYAFRSKLGLWQTLQDPAVPRLTSTIGNVVPGLVKRTFGFVSDKEISGVVDASGFRYSDSFNLRAIKGEALMSRRWERGGVPHVLLPQAFGPFTESDKREWSRELFENSDLIFARDRVSADYLTELNLSTPIELSPDFTITLSAASIEAPMPGSFAALVPNSKLISTNVASRRQYLDILSGYGHAANARGLEVLVVIHEAGDTEIASDLANLLNTKVYSDSDPRVLKAILSQAELVVASRFHAIVGALSQEVPTIALGWSHKYQELLNDFGVGHWLTTVESEPADIVGAVLDDKEGQENLRTNKVVLETKVGDMWTRTKLVLGVQESI